MTERPPDDELARERRESTDLGYRDTEEEQAYEEAAAQDEAKDDDDEDDR
ncbi:MAG: hypothetical protein WAL63_03375 [Solirubrobacteraceae bacterium]